MTRVEFAAWKEHFRAVCLEPGQESDWLDEWFSALEPYALDIAKAAATHTKATTLPSDGGPRLWLNRIAVYCRARTGPLGNRKLPVAEATFLRDDVGQGEEWKASKWRQELLKRRTGNGNQAEPRKI